MASSADHQQEAASQPQQELVKLLTRHFHHQFYHMTAANAAANHQHHQHSQQLPTSAPNPTDSLALRPAANYQQRAHYQPIFGSGSFDLGNGLNPETGANISQQQQQLQLQNQILRSQPPNSSNGSSNSNSNNNNSNSANDTGAMNNTLLVDYTLRNSLNPYALPPELNLFNALGLANLNNSQQLVLNLQQHHQALLQQAAAAAVVSASNRQHYGLRGESINQSTGALNQHLGEQLAEERIRLSPSPGRHHESEADGKQFLKFSINTILGQTVSNSPVDKPVDSIEIIKQHLEQQHHHHHQKPFDGPTTAIRRANQQLLDKMMMNNSIKTEPKLDEIDDSSSDTSISSSINTSTTPSLASAPPPPPPTQSILFNPSHHSANNNNNTNINTNSAHSNKTGQTNLQRQQQHHGHPTLPFLSGPAAAFPWTVAARGKPRRGMMRRAVFSDSQRVGLERRFQLQKYISKPDRKKLAEKLGLRDSQVKIWFQNRRMKWRNSKERELLSAGGSREQTLPTRNNPNPDLSDVGETIKRLASATATTTNAAATTDPSPNLPL